MMVIEMVIMIHGDWDGEVIMHDGKKTVIVFPFEGWTMIVNYNKIKTVETVKKQVASLWLALDDVTIENGAMDMFPFSSLPEV